MKFDNKQFESGVAQSMSTLDKLKAKLNFTGAAKSFNEISVAADSVSFNGLIDQTSKVGIKFDALAAIAVSALNRITNEAITAGKNLVKSLSIDQVSAGWSKYEARTAAVQTLVNATGKSVAEIERYMDKLMLYSDETSYGFADMTSSLATMVSAGGDINKLVPLLEGFGNAVSFVGKGAAEYQRAVIQLSQGYGRNALMLEDWKSIEQTLGGAKQLKEVFIEVAEELGKIEKGEITIGTFNESLRDKWLDQKVMEEALGRFGEMTERAFEMVEAGEAKNVAEAYEILSESVDDYRIKAAKAAQEAKSFTEAIDATKDAVSTKWMESFQIIFGNYAQATELWTELTNTLWDLFAASGDVRNEILKMWSALGGRDEMIRAVKAAFEALSKPLGAVRDAIVEIFFPQKNEMKATILYNATVAVKEFFESITMSDEAVTTLKKSIKLLLIPVYALYQALKIGGVIVAQTIMTIFMLANALLELPSRIISVESPLKRIFGEERYLKLVTAFTTIVNKLGSAFSSIGDNILQAGKSLGSALLPRLEESFANIVKFLAPIAEWMLDKIVSAFEYLANFDYNTIVNWVLTAVDTLVNGLQMIIEWCASGGRAVVDLFRSFTDMTPIEILKAIGNVLVGMKDKLVEFGRSLGFGPMLESISNAGAKVIDVLSDLGSAIMDVIGRLTPAKILVFSFGVVMIWMMINISRAMDTFNSIGESFTEAIEAVTSVFKGFKQNVLASPILQVAVAIGVLAISLGALSMIDSEKLKTAALALGSLMAIMGVLMVGMALISKFLLTSEVIAKNLIVIGQALLFMAGTVAILAAALMVLSNVNMEGIILKLLAFWAMLDLVVAAAIITSKLISASIADAAYILAFAASMYLIVSALAKLNSLDLRNSVGNLVTISIIVTMMTVLSKASKGVRFTSGASIIAFAAGLLLFIQMMKPIANLDAAELIQALFNISLILAVITGFGALGKLLGSDGSIIKDVGVGMLSMSAGLMVLYFAIRMIGNLKASVILKGIAAISAIMIVLTSLNAISAIVSKETGGAKLEGSFLALASAVLVLGIAINYIGGLELSKIIKGTAVVSAVLALLAVLGKSLSSIDKATKTVIAMTVCIGILVASIALLTLLDGLDMLKATASISVALLSLGGMLKLMEKTLGPDEGKKGIVATVALVGVILFGIYELFSLMSKIGKDSNDALKASASIGLVLMTLGTSMYILSKSNGQSSLAEADWKKYLKQIGIMITVLGSVAGAIALVGLVPDNSNQIIQKAAAIGIVISTLAASITILTKSGNAEFNNMNDALSALGILAVATAAIMTVLTVVFSGKNSNFDANRLLASSAAFSAILMSLSGAVALIIKIASQIEGGIDSKTAKSILALSGIVDLLGVVAVGLTAAMIGVSHIPVGENLLGTVLTTIAVLAALTVATAILTKLSVGISAVEGFFASGTLKMSSIAGLVALMAVFLTALIEVTSMIPTEDKLYQSLGIFIVSLVIVVSLTAILTALGPALATLQGTAEGVYTGILIALGAIAILVVAAALLGALVVLMVAGFAEIVRYVEEFDGSDYVASIQHLADIMYEIGQAFGRLVVGFYEPISELGLDILADLLEIFGVALEDLGTHLSRFARNAKDFLELSINPSLPLLFTSLITGIVGAIASDAFLTIANLFGFDILSDFGEALSTLAPYLVDFCTQMSGVPANDNMAAIAQSIAALAVALVAVPLEGGLWGMIIGNRNVKEFGRGIKSLAEGIGDYAIALKEAEVDDETLSKTVSLTATLVELANKIPLANGALQILAGEVDYTKFTLGIMDMGMALQDFCNKANEIKEDYDEEAVQAMLDLTDDLIILASKVPKTGDLMKFFGQHDIGAFGDQLDKYSMGLYYFFDNLKGVTIDTNVAEQAKIAGEIMVDLANKIPLSGNFLDFFTGTQDLGNFGSTLPEFGAGLASFFTSFLGVEGINANSVAVAKEAGMALVEMSNSLDSNFGISAIWESTSLETFGSNIESLGKSMAKFYESVKDIGWSAFFNAVSCLESIVDTGLNMKNLDVGAVNTFKQYMTELASAGVNDFTATFVNAEGRIALTISNILTRAINTAKNRVKDNVSYSFIVDCILTGMDGHEDEIANKAIEIVKSARDVFMEQGVIFESIGALIVESIISGLKNEMDTVRQAIKELIDTIIDAANDELGISGGVSSKFKRLGEISASSYADGLESNAGSANRSVTEFGEDLVDNFSEAIGVGSSSNKFQEIGMYTVQGFNKGIEDNLTSAKKSMVKMGETLLGTIKDYYGIHSPSVVMRDEVGRYIIQGIAEGITEDMSAEEAAQKKAQNIISAFQDEFNKWSLKTSSAELDFKLWGTTNLSATEREVKDKEVELLEQKLANQAERVNAANAQYQALLNSGYATTQQIQEANNTYKQEQLAMWELANQLVDMRTQAAELLDLERAELEFEQWKLLNADASDSALKAKEAELMTKKLESQAAVVASAGNMYNRMLELYGENAKATKEALNEYITEQNSMLQLANQYIQDYNIAPPSEDERQAAMERDLELYQIYMDEYRKGYITWEKMKEMTAMLEEKGFSAGIAKDIEKANQYNRTAADVMEQYVSNVAGQIDDMETSAEIIDRFLSSASGSINGIVGNIDYALVNSGGSSSKSGVSSVLSGLSGITDVGDIQNEIEKAMGEVSDAFDFSDLTNGLTGGIIDSIRNSIGGFGDGLIDMAVGGFDKLRDFLGLTNGDGVGGFVSDIGSSVADFFGIGISNNTDTVNDSAMALGAAAVDGISNVPDRYRDVANNSALAFANALTDNRFLMSNAARQAAAATIDSTMREFDIHSPSRVYYWIGEMLNEGLANGIEDTASVLRGAVETVMDVAQTAIDDNGLTVDITPVYTDDYLQYASDKPSNYQQTLRVNQNGGVDPYGYREQTDKVDQGWWITATQQITQSVQQLSASEEARRIRDEAMMAEYREAIEELKTAATQMSEQPTGITFNQNNYSPQALTPSTIYRNTKTALASASAAASPTGRNITN